MKLIVVTLTTSQFITMTHSRANRVFSLYWLDCFDSVDGDLNEGGVFSWRKKIGPSLSLCPSPSLSPQLRHREGPVFSRCAFGSDLITYLFGLSYSKLHWLCVLLRAEAFSPSRPPPVSIPSCLLAADCCHSPGESLSRTLFSASSPAFDDSVDPRPSHFIARRSHSFGGL